MFCDLVGSTALSTRLDPEDLREIIGAYHRCCAEVITKSGGFVARYLGDGVLAYFGYPQAHEDDAERAVRAGLALVEGVAKLDAGEATSLHLRVGIATGLVVVGDLIGGDAAHENEVVGATPNLAARLQAFAEPDAVVVDNTSHLLIGGLFEYRALGSVTFKGFPNPVPVWQVIGTSILDSRFEALRATRTPLVGREEEIELLLRRWRQAANRDGRVVLLSGEPGIGKSRLTAELQERLQAESHTCLHHFCSPHHQDSPLHPIISQLQRAAGFRRDDTDEQRLDKLDGDACPSDRRSHRGCPANREFAVVPTGDRYPPLDLTPQKRKEKTLQALLAQLEGMAAREPVLVVFEDVHWSRPHIAGAARPDRRTGTRPTYAADHHLPAGILAAVVRPPARNFARAQSPLAHAARRDDRRGERWQGVAARDRRPDHRSYRRRSAIHRRADQDRG